MKTAFCAVVFFSGTCLFASGADDSNVVSGPPRIAPPQGQPPSAATNLMNAMNGALFNAVTQGGPDANPQAVAMAFHKEMGKVDMKAMGLKPAVTETDVETLSKNLSGIKELFERTEAAFKAERYREAALGYGSVSLASVPGSEDYAAKSRDRLIELEAKAKEHLNRARDAESVRSDYSLAARELNILIREFPDTVAGKQAIQEMAGLRSRPAAAAFLDLEQARSLLQQGKVAAALQQLHSITENPRYRDTIAAIEARRQAQEVSDNPVLRKLIDAEATIKSERTAQSLLAQARNLLKNNMNDKATAALKEIVALHPDTPSATEARRMLEDGK
jgi:hypothetical protein